MDLIHAGPNLGSPRVGLSGSALLVISEHLMYSAPQNSLRLNPFHTYRDPETGHWITVLPNTPEAISKAIGRPPQRLRFIDPDHFYQDTAHLS